MRNLLYTLLPYFFSRRTYRDPLSGELVKVGLEVFEKHQIIIEKHPLAEQLNPKLINDYELSPKENSYKTNVKAKMTSYYTDSPTVTIIEEWVRQLLMEKSTLRTALRSEHGFQLNFDDTWFSGYDIDEFTAKHDHTPSTFSWVYFVRTPPKSSPLVLTTSGTQIKAEAGKVAIFAGNVWHHVPPNKCEGRIVLAGNINAEKDHTFGSRTKQKDSKYR